MPVHPATLGLAVCLHGSGNALLAAYCGCPLPNGKISQEQQARVGHERVGSGFVQDIYQLPASIAKAAAATNPGHAERLAASIADEAAQAWALSGIAEAVAATDPDRAEYLVASINDEGARVAALSAIAKALTSMSAQHAS